MSPAFDAMQLDARLAADPRRWAAVLCFDRIDSTQDALRRELYEHPLPPDQWRVAVADEQTAGRGRTGSAWVAPAGSALLLTVGARLQAAAALWPRTALVTGLAVAEALAAFGVDARLKWPNDLMVRTDGPGGSWRKVAGILCERIEDSQGQPVWLCGVGVDVTAPRPWPAALREVAAALDELVPQPPSREELAATLCLSLRSAIERWQAGGGDLDVPALEARLLFLGEPVELDFGPAEGRRRVQWLGLQPDGGLRIRDLGVDGTPGPERTAQPLNLTAAFGHSPWRAPPRLAPVAGG